MRGLSEHYRTLGLEPGASAAAIKEAYRDLAKVWHPDRFAHDQRLRAKADEKLREINAAYRALRESAPADAEATPPKPAPKPKPAPVPKPEPAPVVAERAPPAEPRRPRDAPRVSPTHRRSRRWPLLLGLLALVAVVVAAVKYGERRGAEQRTVSTPTPTAVADAGVASGPAAASDAAAVGTEPSYFTLGSTEDEVRAVMGPPDRTFEIHGVKWFWDMDTVHFRDGRVVGWDQSFDRRLRVTLPPRDAAAAERARLRGYIELGSSEDEVLAVQGTPDAITHVIDTRWRFGMGHVTLTDGRVSGWFQSSGGDLRLPPGAPEHR